MLLEVAVVEHFLFFPVIVLLSLILIILSIRLILRVILFLLVIFAIWYGLSYTGLVPSPLDMYHEFILQNQQDPKIASRVDI